MFSLRSEDQKDHRGGEKQLFLSGLPAGAARGDVAKKEYETCGAVARVEGLAVLFRQLEC